MADLPHPVGKETNVSLPSLPDTNHSITPNCLSFNPSIPIRRDARS